MCLRGETLSSLNLFLSQITARVLHVPDPHYRFAALNCIWQTLPSSVGISTPCLIAQGSPDFSFHTSSYTTDCLQRVIVGLLAAVNWTEECLMITLTYWPEFSCLDHRAHHFPHSSDDHLIFGNGDHWLPPTTPTMHIPIEVISPPGKMPFWLKLFSMGSKPKMFGPFLFFDGKIPLIYHKR